MDKRIERKIGLLHTLLGAIIGIISGLYIKGTNLSIINVLFIGMILTYPLFPLSKRLFNLSEKDFQLKHWLIKGFFLFFITWILVWTFVYNIVS